MELRRGFAVVQNVSVEFRFCCKVFGICFAKLRNCFTELICIGKELSGVSTKLETGSAKALSGLSDLRSVAAESEICFKTHRFGSAELNSIREELLHVSLDFQYSYLKL